MNAPEKLTTRIKLPSAVGKLEEFRLSAPRDFGAAGRKTFNRIALAAGVAAYEEQCEAIEGLGGRIVLMASRALTACARSPDDYQKVYSRVLCQVKRPVIIHWLGEMFDPQLAGYWGEKDHGRATNA